MVFIEALSLYMGVELLYTACWLPGSWKMYRRSNWYFGQGFPAAAAVLQVAVMGACWRWGWRVFNRRRWEIGGSISGFSQYMSGEKNQRNLAAINIRISREKEQFGEVAGKQA